MAKIPKTPVVPIPNDFQSIFDKAFHAAQPYLKPIGIGLAAIVVVVVAATVWSGMQDKKAGVATLELGKVLDTATARVEEGGPDLESLTTGAEPAPARFKTFKDRSEADVAAVQALDATYGGSKVARSGSLIAAGALYDLGKYDEAIAAYRKLLDASAGPDLAAMAHEGIGYALEAKALAQTDAAARSAGLDEALKAYDDLAHDEKDARYTTVLYHQARLQALKGQKQAAVDLYKKILEKNPGPILTEEVQGRLSLLDVAPAPAAAPGAPAPAAPPAPAPGK